MLLRRGERRVGIARFANLLLGTRAGLPVGASRGDPEGRPRIAFE